jgi:hypothetical protein
MTLRLTLAAGIFATLMAVGVSPANAGPKPWYWSWWPSHWYNLDYQPYLEDGKHPHNTQWDDKTWEPADWAAQRPKGADDVIKAFYRADILSRQYMDGEMPVLEVGPNFYNLSGYDKRRIARMVDDHYQITANHENGMFMLYDWRTHEPIGSYTAYGLQIQ